LKILVTGFQEAFAYKDYLAAANAKQTLQPVPPAYPTKEGMFKTIQSLGFAHPGRLRRLIPAGYKRLRSNGRVISRVLATATLGIIAFDLGWQYPSRGVELHRFSCARAATSGNYHHFLFSTFSAI
jgi:hypothetical protein